MKRFRLSILSCAILFCGVAQAEIYKRVDANGRVTYSSAPLKGGKKLQLEPLPTMAPQPVPPRMSNRNSDFRVDESTQSKRDDTRRKILEDELATEQKALEDARAKLQVTQDTPEVYKSADGKTYRNIPKYEKNVSDAQEEVTAHENNVKALKSEISHLK
ncbi:MAG: DUF4124 domain-containing protein [Sideroxydans sp.]|nr:DUF4124 domain-containing protein [Sideroxydans sp.]